jgi:DeoR/GlpR family transcriptional regulator of sugar metabolism
MSTKIFREERLQRIVELVRAEKKVFVEDLAIQFDVSPSSIRLDLAEMEHRGLIKRTHGGAIVPEKIEGHMVTQKSPFELRISVNQAEKDAIGRAAAALVEDGDTLMIDGGSTTFYVARHLAGKHNLTLITNSLSLLPELYALPDAHVYLTGGLVEMNQSTVQGDIALDTIARFRTAKAILGVDGISLASGLSAVSLDVAAIKRKMITASQRLIIVADHTKFNQVCLVPLVALEEMNVLITDSGAPEHMLEAIQGYGPKIIVAPTT